MATSTQWQLAQAAAERYADILVPVILGPAARVLVEHVRLDEGATVVDVGCGTGAAACFAARRVGERGRVVGIDVNLAMLEVARSLSAPDEPPVHWQAASASALPLADGVADVVPCAQTLQFLADRIGATREMRRVLKPGGRVGVSVWTDVRESPYFDALLDGVRSHVGADTAAALQAAFALTGADELCELLEAAEFDDVVASKETLELELPPLLEFVPRHVSATPTASAFAAAEPSTRREVVRTVIERVAAGNGEAVVRTPFTMRVAVASR